MTGLLVLFAGVGLGLYALSRSGRPATAEDRATAELDALFAQFGAEYHAFVQGMLLTPEQFSSEQILQTASELHRLGYGALASLLVERGAST